MAAGPPRLGSEERTQRPPTVAPIDRVIVYSDRARVFRVAQLDAERGGQVVRFPRLPPNVIESSVRVSAQGARVRRAEASVVETEAITIADVRTKLEAFEQALDKRAALVDQQRLIRSEIEMLRSIQPAAFVPEAERDGRPLVGVTPSTWLASARFLVSRADRGRRQLETLQKTLRPIDSDLDRRRRELQAVNLYGDPRRYTEVFAVIETTKAGRVTLTLEYTVPGPTWHPIYDLQYAPNDAKLSVFTAAVVRQQTGEDWSNAELSFSTGLPSESIALPELLTWTLGEARDFMPQVRPARPAPTPAPMAPPLRPEPGPSDDLIALREQFNAALGERDRRTATGDLVKKERRRRRKDKSAVRQPRPPASPMAEEPAPTIATESVDAEEIIVTGSRTSASRSRKRRRESVKYAQKALALSQADAPDLLRRLASSTPAAMTRGIEYMYVAPTRTTVSSDNRSLKVPVSVERFETQGFYQATPGLSKTAYLRARLVNQSTRPMLAGQTNIFVNGRFIGQGQVRTTAPQKQVEFGLGADEQIKVVRNVMPQTREEGVFSKDTITRYRVLIEAANYHRRPINLEIVEPLPKSTKDDIEIKVVSMKPAPVGKPDAHGIARFSLNLAPGARQTIELVYEIERPADFELRQR